MGHVRLRCLKRSLVQLPGCSPAAPRDASSMTSPWRHPSFTACIHKCCSAPAEMSPLAHIHNKDVPKQLCTEVEVSEEPDSTDACMSILLILLPMIGILMAEATTKMCSNQTVYAHPCMIDISGSTAGTAPSTGATYSSTGVYSPVLALQRVPPAERPPLEEPF